MLKKIGNLYRRHNLKFFEKRCTIFTKELITKPLFYKNLIVYKIKPKKTLIPFSKKIKINT